MPVPWPAIAAIETECREPSVAPRKPWLVTSTMPPMPAEAEAPPDLLTPLDAECGFFRLARAPFQQVDAGHVGIEQIEIGKFAGEQRRIGEPGEFVLGRDAGHGDRALGQRIDAVALDVVRRDRRLAAADQHAQADIVAFGALQFFDRAVAHVDRQRDRAHRDRIGLVGAAAPCRGDEAGGEIGEGGLIEEGGHLRAGNRFMWMGVPRQAAMGQAEDVPVSAHVSTGNLSNCAGSRQPLVNHAGGATGL